jgi:hypothetical protein
MSPAPDSLFGFVQFEFGFLLGPGDGRFLVRRGPDEDPERVLVLATLGAPERRRFKDRKGRDVREAQPEPVPTNRATVIQARPFEGPEEASVWLSEVQQSAERADSELASAAEVLARALHAHRAAHADPHPRDVSPAQALVVRIGYGDGNAVAEGRYDEAWELPRERRRTRRSMEAPEERFAALLGGREHVLVCEELVLRVRADLIAGRTREAALGARVALESVLAELGSELAASRREGLESDRTAVGDAANTALRGALTPELAAALVEATQHMEAALRARRLESAT